MPSVTDKIQILTSVSIASKFARNEPKKVAVPKKDEKPIMGLVSDITFHQSKLSIDPSILKELLQLQVLSV